MTIIILPRRCDRAAAEMLLPELAEQTGAGAIEIDGRHVEQIGLAMLQVLISARRTGQGALITPSPSLAEATRLVGLSDELFSEAKP